KLQRVGLVRTGRASGHAARHRGAFAQRASESHYRADHDEAVDRHGGEPHAGQCAGICRFSAKGTCSARDSGVNRAYLAQLTDVLATALFFSLSISMATTSDNDNAAPVKTGAASISAVGDLYIGKAFHHEVSPAFLNA